MAVGEEWQQRKHGWCCGSCDEENEVYDDAESASSHGEDRYGVVLTIVIFLLLA